MPDGLINLVLFLAGQLFLLIGWGIRTEIRLARLTDRTDGVKEMASELNAMKIEIAKLSTTIETFRVDVLLRPGAHHNER